MKKQFRNINFNSPSKGCVPKLAIIIVLAISILDLFGWIFNIPVLINFKSHWTPMRIITALLLIASAIAVMTVQKGTLFPARRRFVNIAGSIMSFAGLLTIIVYAKVLNTGDELFMEKMTFLNLFLAHDTRMALLTAVVILFIGVILILLADGKTQSANIAHTLLIPAAVLSYFVPVSYLLDVHEFFEADHIFVAPTPAMLYWHCV